MSDSVLRIRLAGKHPIYIIFVFDWIPFPSVIDRKTDAQTNKQFPQSRV